MSSAIILGGGLAGLSYAYGQLKKGYSVTVIEKDNAIGGLMRTFNFNGFLFDFGPHIFRSKDEKVLSFVKNLLNNNYHNISSNPAVFKYGQYFDNVIPIITYKNIETLPNKIKEKIRVEMENANRKLDLSNFENCIISQVGETLYWEFFGEYSKKWWGLDPKNLSSDIAPKNLKIGGKKSYAHITTNFEKPTEEIYPIHGGIFEIVKKLESEVRTNGGIVLTDSRVERLEIDGNEIAKVIVRKNGNEMEIPTNGKLVVSTIPLTLLCRMLGMESDLYYRGDICIFLKLKGDRMLNFSWVYFHDSDIIFSRIYEPLYYSEYNAPKGYTSLCIEVTSFENDAHWRDKYLGEKVVKQLIDLGIVKKNQEPEILAVEKYPYAYPIYTVDYKQKIEEIFDKLKFLKNLKVIGRTGSFSYLNMWQCLRWAVY